ncbi:hypothetical protein SEPCBS119000_005760 [Sporothrix epigloea]|uniref:Uncharacterized protein n=1 Tax=Sporothrix epigloea TaxID=1892477 RepID=A0ABP0DZK1_9PEZI
MDVPTSAPPPTATTTVHFPRRQWTTLDCKWSLVLNATAELHWDPTDLLSDASRGVFRSQKVTAARAAQLVRAGRLWIGTNGRRVDVAVRHTLAGRAVAGGDVGELFRAKLAQVLLHWSAWNNELGLQVVESGCIDSGGTEGDDNTIYLAVSHPPSPHGLYAPRSNGGIPQARLGRVSCQLDLQLDESACKPSPPKRLTKRQKTRQSTKRRQTQSAKARKTSERPSQTEIKARIPHKNTRCRLSAAQARQRQQQQEQEAIRTRDLLVQDAAAWHKATLLVEAALHVLVGTAEASGKRLLVGVQAVDSGSLPGGAPSLLDIAPAVWSSDYFTAVSSRALHLPLIHRCMESFVNAQSPSLRRKAEALTGARDPSTPREMLLWTKLEEVLLRGVPQLPTRIRKPLARLQKTSRPELLSTTIRPEPLSSHASVSSLVDDSDETDGDYAIDLSFDNLEAVFSQTPVDSQSSAGSVKALEAELSDEDADVRVLDWGEIEAWSEPEEYYYSDDDHLHFQEIDDTWSPQDCESNEHSKEGERPDLETDDDPYGSRFFDERGIALWQEMQTEELCQQFSFGKYLDDEDLEFVDVDAIHFDEYVNLWRNESDMVQECC